MVTPRSDGRRQDQHRELSISYDGLNRVDGSARFGFGQTKALASVSGPVEVRLAAEQASRATFEVIVRPLANVPGTEAKSLASTIRTILTPSLLLSHHPRTLIQLVIQSLTPTTSPRLPSTLIASLINASTAALLNTGSVPMRGVICAAAIGRLHSTPGSAPASSASENSSSFLVLDPGEAELASLDAGGCFAFLFAASLGSSGPEMACEPVWSNWQAKTRFDEDELVSARDLAKVGAERVWQTMKESVKWMAAPSGQQGWESVQEINFEMSADTHMPVENDDDRMEI